MRATPTAPPSRPDRRPDPLEEAHANLDGSPRQDFEEVFRSIGAYLDRRGMREILLTEAPDGFIVQGLVIIDSGAWSDLMGQQVKETLTFLDDDIARFMDEAIARRGQRISIPAEAPGYYEQALRVLGEYMDEQKPRDVFFLEQDGSFVDAAADELAGGQPPRPLRVHQGRCGTPDRGRTRPTEARRGRLGHRTQLTSPPSTPYRIGSEHPGGSHEGSQDGRRRPWHHPRGTRRHPACRSRGALRLAEADRRVGRGGARARPGRRVVSTARRADARPTTCHPETAPVSGAVSLFRRRSTAIHLSRSTRAAAPTATDFTCES